MPGYKMFVYLCEGTGMGTTSTHWLQESQHDMPKPYHTIALLVIFLGHSKQMYIYTFGTSIIHGKGFLHLSTYV